MQENAQLQHNNVTIRRYQMSDVMEGYAAVQESKADLVSWLPELAQVRGPDEVIGWIETHGDAWSQGEAYHFAIVHSADGRFLGGCGLTQINQRHRFANLYYWVRRSAQGHSVASSAARLLAQFGCAHIGLKRIEIVVAVENKASVRVPEKARATCEGLLRSRIVIGDTVHDALMFSLIPADFVKRA